ncbi:hypothetical protein CTRI78_v001892 [Colletotrichum trifolii]|uniref:Secreted protein CSS2 C-terminal domain-containing protein n=1 Tax=Colletotrichum trifolii TaxID=5466 RepID=A0A4R8RSW4_COLTR|nr:hypothetical protein CTRI78_v001892 [Colletotrichum trifolii]
MHATTFISAWAFASAALPTALGLSLPSSLHLASRQAQSAKRSPHNFATIDLTDGVPNEPVFGNATADLPLDKRLNVKYCIESEAAVGTCSSVASLVAGIGFGIAGLVKSGSNNHDCTAHEGGIDSVTWRVYATGRNCDTTAQLETIAGAVQNYIRDSDSNLCGVHCIKLTHGGTWTGYVTIAAPGHQVDGYYCGEAESFGKCGSGGKNDA